MRLLNRRSWRPLKMRQAGNRQISCEPSATAACMMSQIAIRRQDGVVQQEAANGVPHRAAHEQKVTAGIGVQLADVPLRRVGNVAVAGAVQTLQPRQQGIIAEIAQQRGDNATS